MRTELTNCRVFDGISAQISAPQRVVVESNKIVSIGAAQTQTPVDQSIDLSSMTLMPGLIDAHFHCNSPSFDIPGLDRFTPSHLAQFARKHLEDMLQLGFTSVRDAGGADVGLVRAVEEGLIDGPRLLIAGKAISQTGGHGDFRVPGQEDYCGCAYKGALSVVVDGVDEMRRQVRDAFHHGAHHIKLFVSGGVLSPSDPIWMDQFHESEIAAAVEEAKTRGSYVMAHAHTANAAVRCVKNGVRSIEHGTMIDQQTADYVADHQAFVVPTLSVIAALKSEVSGLPEESRQKLEVVADKAFKAIEHCHNAGVQLGFGTDYFGHLHGQELMELTERAKAQSNLEVLKSATSVNAALIQKENALGVVQTGALADLIVIDGNPLDDISAMSDAKNIKLVMKDGRIVRNEIGRN